MNTQITPETTPNVNISKTWKRSSVLVTCALIIGGILGGAVAYTAFVAPSHTASATAPSSFHAEGIAHRLQEQPEDNGNRAGAARIRVQDEQTKIREATKTLDTAAAEAYIAELVQQTSFGFETKTEAFNTRLFQGPTILQPDIRVTGTWDRYFIESISPDGTQFYQAEMMHSFQISSITYGDADLRWNEQSGYGQFNIDPPVYEKFFPEEYKIHNNLLDWFY